MHWTRMSATRWLIVLGLAALMVGTAQARVRVNPENNQRLGPRDNPGYFLGYPNPTYQWHGCTRTATANNGRPPQQGAPPRPRGNLQRAVKFTLNREAPPYFRWRANPGYRICGVQATVQLKNPAVRSILLAEVGYTSGLFAGSTVTSGKETITVFIARNAINRRDFAGYEGKRYTMSVIEDVTVFVRRTS